MKRIILPAILTLCTAILPGAVASAQDVAVDKGGAGHPQAVVEKAVVDVGTVAKSKKVAVDFVIENRGDAPLEITDVKPTCGCTVADYDRTIPVGAAGKVHAVIDTTNLGGPTAKTIAVFTNDPINPRIELTVKADVKPYLLITPGYARFTQPQGSDPSTVEQLVFTQTFDDLEVTKVESPFPYMKVAYRPAVGDEIREGATGKQWVVDVTFDYPQAPIGTVAGFVKIHTNHPDQPLAEIPVSGFVRPMIAVTPVEADFGTIDTSKPQDARLLIRSFDPVDIDVTSAETDVPGVKLEVVPVEEGRRFSLVVTLTPEVPKGAFNGKITIHTTSERKPVVEVPLRGTAI